MIQWTTAGESHGRALIGIIEGIPSGVRLDPDTITGALKRRRFGAGRGARMRIEEDTWQFLSGVRRRKTTGAPIAVEIANTEWKKWEDVLSPTQAPHSELGSETARAMPLTAPRPGHADLPGMLTYRLDDARDVLERASARETAMRVALGAIAAQVLQQAAGIVVVGHVVRIGSVDARAYAQQQIPTPADSDRLDQSPTRSLLNEDNEAFVKAIADAQHNGETVGGQVEIVAWNVPLGIGTYTSPFERLDAKIAGAMMSIPSAKSVEIGRATDQTRCAGSVAHDEIRLEDGHLFRPSNNAGGIEGGTSNGQPILVSVGFKPIPTVPKAGRTFDMVTGAPVPAFAQRSDTCQVVPAVVIAEAQLSLELLRAVTDRFGGRSLAELRDQIALANDYVDARLTALSARCPR